MKPNNLETISTTLPLSIVRGGPRDFRYDAIENTVAEILLSVKADINTYIQTNNNDTFNILSYLIIEKSIFNSMSNNLITLQTVIKAINNRCNIHIHYML